MSPEEALEAMIFFLKNCSMNDYRREGGSLLGVNRHVGERL